MINNEFGIKLQTLVIIIVLSSITACTAPKYPPAPSIGGTPAENSYEYIIGPGDSLNIFVWGYADLQDVVPVRPDGRITTKLVEDLEASGKTPTALARELEDSYVAFVNDPSITVLVEEFSGSPNQQVRIIAAGDEASTIPYVKGMTLLDLIIDVGGIDEFASGNRAVLVREGEFGSEKYSLRIDDLVRKSDISANVLLLPGDVVLIPESWL